MRLLRGLVVALLLGLQAAALWESARQDSASYDEVEYVYSGCLMWRHGDFSVNAHPPLVKGLAGLAIQPLSPSLEAPPERGPVRTAWPEAKRFVYANRADAQALLLAARRPMLALWAGLGALVYLWSARLYGPAGGFVSLLLYLACPNLAGQGRLVSTDVGLAAFGTLACFALASAGGRPGWRRFALAGIALGLALGCRHQAGVIAVLAPVLLIASGLRGARRVLLWTALVWGVAALVLAALYGFVHLPLYVEGARFFGRFLAHPFFLDGQVSWDGWYRYFPLLAVYKLPPSHLAAVALVAASLAVRRPKGAEWALVLPAVALFGLAVASRINYGFRHVLVVLPLLWVLAGRLALALPAPRTRSGAVGWAALAVLLVWGAVELRRAHPHYVAYFSPLAGGPAAGWRHAVDSNLDGGQALAHLARRLEAMGRPDVYLAYFGTADPAYHGIRYRYLPGYHDRERLARETAREPFPRWIAVSATYLQLYGDGAYHFLREHVPVATPGWAIRIYDRRAHPEWLAWLAAAYLQADLVDRAALHLRQLADESPAALGRAWPGLRARLAGQPKLYLNFGVALEAAGFEERAREAFVELAARPEDPAGARMARRNLGVLLSHRGRRRWDAGDFAGAAAAYEEAWRASGEPEHRDNRFRSLARGGRQEEARRAFARDPELVRRHGTLERYLEVLRGGR